MQTESEIFHEEHPVELSEEERITRARQAARLDVALVAQRERAKKKKELADEEKRITEALHAASAAAETGEEKRPVKCQDVLRGAMVETLRLDTHETVFVRQATKEELAGGPIVPKGKKPDDIEDHRSAAH